jgi:hypothetical protein
MNVNVHVLFINEDWREIMQNKDGYDKNIYFSQYLVFTLDFYYIFMIKLHFITKKETYTNVKTETVLYV